MSRKPWQKTHNIRTTSEVEFVIRCPKCGGEAMITKKPKISPKDFSMKSSWVEI